MNINNKSILKSRLRLTKPAFVQLVLFGLSKAKGFATQAKGFDIVVRSIEHASTELEKEGANQKLLINLSISKSQGWMPFQAETQLNVDWTFKLSDKGGYPAIQILKLAVSSTKKTEIGILNLSVGLPRIIEKKLFSEIQERIPEIEKVANRQIRIAFKDLLDKTYDIQLADRPLAKQPKVKLDKWLWDSAMVDAELAVDLQLHLQFSWMETLFNESKMQVQKRVFPENGKSLIRIAIPYEELCYRGRGVKIPLGRAGQAEIDSIHIECQKRSQSHVRLKLVGDVAADVDFDLEVKSKYGIQLKIANLDLQLENILLDFGASLFESKIQDAIQKEIDKQAAKQFSHLLAKVNNEMSNLHQNIFIQDRLLELEDVKIKVEFYQHAMLIILQTNYFMEIKINNIPMNLIEPKTHH